MLRIELYSFGYHKSGVPTDVSGHGGGFVFDCRGLPNPGREEQYRNLTGLDDAVAAYLQEQRETGVFLAHALTLIELTASAHASRGFTHLQVAFGCTGGQHRSVYCAEYAARQLRAHGYDCVVWHAERKDWP